MVKQAVLSKLHYYCTAPRPDLLAAQLALTLTTHATAELPRLLLAGAALPRLCTCRPTPSAPGAAVLCDGGRQSLLRRRDARAAAGGQGGSGDGDGGGGVRRGGALQQRGACVAGRQAGQGAIVGRVQGAAKPPSPATLKPARLPTHPSHLQQCQRAPAPLHYLRHHVALERHSGLPAPRLAELEGAGGTGARRARRPAAAAGAEALGHPLQLGIPGVLRLGLSAAGVPVYFTSVLAHPDKMGGSGPTRSGCSGHEEPAALVSTVSALSAVASLSGHSGAGQGSHSGRRQALLPGSCDRGCRGRGHRRFPPAHSCAGFGPYGHGV